MFNAARDSHGQYRLFFPGKNGDFHCWFNLKRNYFASPAEKPQALLFWRKSHLEFLPGWRQPPRQKSTFMKKVVAP